LIRLLFNNWQLGLNLVLPTKLIEFYRIPTPENIFMKHIAALLFVLSLAASVFGQSRKPDFPTPVVQNEITGAITPRDIGDSRLTQHFYTFFADNGDLFVNLETANFTGDVDFFAAGTMRPLSKISFYGDATKTSRIVYFRQREQIVLRVEGRTPNDETANYKINFTGSFSAAADLPLPPEDFDPQIKEKTTETATARVNSVGTIIEAIQSQPKPESVINAPEAENVAAIVTEKPVPRRRLPRTTTAKRPKSQPDKEPTETAESAPPTTPEATPKPASRRPPARTARKKTTNRPVTVAKAEPIPDPLINVRLVVELKDGYKIERPMSEILRVSVDKNQLVVIAKNGKIERFVLLDVLKFSIEQ
jgi:hypothetical protein